MSSVSELLRIGSVEELESNYKTIEKTLERNDLKQTTDKSVKLSSTNFYGSDYNKATVIRGIRYQFNNKKINANTFPLFSMKGMLNKLNNTSKFKNPKQTQMSIETVDCRNYFSKVAEGVNLDKAINTLRMSINCPYFQEYLETEESNNNFTVNDKNGLKSALASTFKGLYKVTVGVDDEFNKQSAATVKFLLNSRISYPKDSDYSKFEHSRAGVYNIGNENCGFSIFGTTTIQLFEKLGAYGPVELLITGGFENNQVLLKYLVSCMDLVIENKKNGSNSAYAFINIIIAGKFLKDYIDIAICSKDPEKTFINLVQNLNFVLAISTLHKSRFITNKARSDGFSILSSLIREDIECLFDNRINETCITFVSVHVDEYLNGDEKIVLYTPVIHINGVIAGKKADIETTAVIGGDESDSEED